MKKLFLVALFTLSLGAITTLQAQDTTRRTKQTTQTSKQKASSKKTKQNAKPYRKESMRTGDSMNRRRRDSI